MKKYISYFKNHERYKENFFFISNNKDLFKKINKEIKKYSNLKYNYVPGRCKIKNDYLETTILYPDNTVGYFKTSFLDSGDVYIDDLKGHSKRVLLSKYEIISPREFLKLIRTLFMYSYKKTFDSFDFKHIDYQYGFGKTKSISFI